MTTDDATYDRVVQDGTVSVPTDHAAQEACVFNESGAVLGYIQVGSDGIIPVDAVHGAHVTVVIPGDGRMEAHDN